MLVTYLQRKTLSVKRTLLILHNVIRWRNRVMDARSWRTTGVTQVDILQICYFLFCFFYQLFFLNEDRNTVSSLPLQTVLMEEVAYVKKIIVTGGTHTSYSS